MNIKKAMKVLKAAERLKKYCSEHDTCKGCMFHNDNSRYIYACMIRRTNPEEYDMNKISRGDISE